MYTINLIYKYLLSIYIYINKILFHQKREKERKIFCNLKANIILAKGEYRDSDILQMQQYLPTLTKIEPNKLIHKNRTRSYVRFKS
jgi:hypothetical protein